MKTPHSSTENAEDRWAQARERMVRQQIMRRGITDPRVLEAMGKVPRHLFVPEHSRQMAYDDGPLSIGFQQTISQPYIVAVMTQLLLAEPHHRVLEVGVGSGYQTAVLAELVEEVIGIERIPELALQAEQRLKQLGYTNISIHIGDGSLGFPARAPYNGILVAAAAPRIPAPLLEQLAPGGRLVIPVGSDYEQVIQRAERTAQGIRVEPLIPVRFVPLIGKHGYSEPDS